MLIFTMLHVCSSPPHSLHVLFHSRKVMVQTSMYHPPLHSVSGTGKDNTSSESYVHGSTFDVNAAMVLVVLLCALVCALGLNSITRCVLRCSSRINFESREQGEARLANTGVKRKALRSFPTLIYSASSKLPGLDSECAICLSEFVAEECVRVLPKCKHGFHTRCIDKWLASHSSCPTCRQCLYNTCRKMCVGSRATTIDLPPASQLTPLEPEGVVDTYWGI